MKSPDNDYCGSVVVPIESEYRRSIKEIVTKIEQHRRKELSDSSLVEFHNLYVAYSVLLLMSATGARPINDPFSHLGDLDLEEGFVLLNDKLSLDVHKNRLVWLAPQATSQLHKYNSHLEAVVRISLRKNKKSTAEYVNSLLIYPRHDRQCLPLFFLLDSDLKPTPLTVGSLFDTVGETWKDRQNVGRHLLETELWNLKCPAWAVDALAGHSFDGRHPFGERSERSYVEMRNIVAPLLESLLIRWSWHAIDGLEHGGRKKLTTRLPSFALWEFGKDQRLRERKAKLRMIQGLLRAAADASVPGKTNIERHDLFKLALNAAGDEPELAALAVQSLQEDATTKRASKKLKTRTLSVPMASESSPLSDSWTEEYKRFKQSYTYFLRRYSNSERPHQSGVEYLWAEICVSAALNGLCSGPWLEALAKTHPQEVYRQGTVLFWDLYVESSEETEQRKSPDWRWLPDPLSKGLVYGFFERLESGSTSVKTPEGGGKITAFNENAILAAVKKIGREIGLELGGDLGEVCRKLAAFSWSYWSIRYPGYLRGVMEGSTRVTPLPQQAIGRLLTASYVELESNKNAGKEERVFDDPYLALAEEQSELATSTVTSARPKNSSRISSKASYSRLRGWISENIPKSTTGNSRSRNKKVYKAATKTLRSDLYLVAPNCRYVLEWICKMASIGTVSKEVPSFSAINGYASEVLNILELFDIDVNLIEMDADSIEELIIEGVQALKRKDPGYVLDRFHDFHDFLREFKGAKKIDWALIYLNVGVLYEGKVDSQYLCEWEYFEVRRSPLLGASDAERLRMRAALLFGYRFGLRVGEVAELEIQDIQLVSREDQRKNDDKCSQIIVQTHKLKSFSGIRQIALGEKLSDEEMEDLRELLSVKNGAPIDTKLLSVFEETIDKSHVSRCVGKALKWITGDPDFRFHHLRHSWVTRNTFFVLCNDERSPVMQAMFEVMSPVGLARTDLFQRERKNNCSLDSISEMVGHANLVPSTTLTSYTHCLEFVVQDLCWRESPTIGDTDFVASVMHLNRSKIIRRMREGGIRNECAHQVLGQINKIPGVTNRIKQRLSIPRYQLESITLPISTDIALENIDRIFRVYAIRRRQLEGLGAAVGLSQVLCEDQISRGGEMEATSGYHLYGIRAPGHYFPRLPEANIPAFRRDSRNFRALLGDTERKLRHLKDEVNFELDEQLRTWMRLYESTTDAEIWLSDDSDMEIDKIVRLALWLGVAQSQLEFRVPYEKCSVAYRAIESDMESKYPEISVTKSRHGIASHIDRKSGRVKIGLSFRRRDESGRITVRSVNRIAFLLSLKRGLT